MNHCKTASRSPDSRAFPTEELAQLLAGLERQKEDLGPIADELLELLQPERQWYREEVG